MGFAFDVGCWTFSVRRFSAHSGRVAESGLRHSTRNRAWGNPPWVRIPPLPPDSLWSDWEVARLAKNVRKFGLILVDFAPHIVCPPNGSAITCYALEFTSY